MPPCASSSSWSGLQHSLQVVPLQHSRLGRRPAGGPPLSIPCRRTSPPRAPGGSPSIAGRGPLRFPQRGGSHAPSLTPSWCCVCTPALAGSTTLRGLVNCQAAHTATAQHRSPRSRAQGKGESLTTAHVLSEPRSFDDGQDRSGSSPHISSQCNGTADASCIPPWHVQVRRYEHHGMLVVPAHTGLVRSRASTVAVHRAATGT